MNWYKGCFEHLSNGQAQGWAQADSGLPVRVGLYVDDVFICAALADLPHTIKKNCGFALNLPPECFDDRLHAIDVRYEPVGVSINGLAFKIVPDGNQHLAPVSQADVQPDKSLPVLPYENRHTTSTVTPSLSRPRIAYILSTRMGGVPETNRDLMAALSDTYEPWVIICDSRCIDIYRFHPEGDIRVERAPLKNPVNPVTLASDDYDIIMRDVLTRYGFDTIHIRHMGWHAASLPALCRQLGLPVLMSLHDYYTVCPSIKLLDDKRQHCGGICTDGQGHCEVELWRQDQFPPLKHAFMYHWRAHFDEALSHCNGFVTTSVAAQDILKQAHPGLQNADFRLIEHGRDFLPQSTRQTNWPMPDQKLKILIPGGISPAKGADIVNALIALNTDGHCEFHILGNGWYIHKNSPHVFDHGAYERDEFAERVNAIAPHIGAVFSIWAETYCHTLTEMWACGLPVLGLAIGAVGERIKTHGGGWALPVDSNPADIYAHLLQIKYHTPIDPVRTQIEVWRQAHDQYHTTADMAAEYDRFYRNLNNQRT